MAVLTTEMKEMVSNYQCFIGTVSKDGYQNIGPKMSTRIFDDETLIFNEGTGGATYQNILDGSNVVVAVVNRELPDGYRFIGKPEVQSSGEIYEKAAAFSEQMGKPRPKAVILTDFRKKSPILKEYGGR
ncbi:MAG TPA: pyridoxamine 5'-phosphate oxidase family protein [Bacillus bacterium]|nr:pyridoxamine 5'-phosphate oxidase family protein [Bacillus sp. (in: firmicutes)]